MPPKFREKKGRERRGEKKKENTRKKERNINKKYKCRDSRA
jgi:hypothetical protein